MTPAESLRRAGGFTLVEAIVVLVITGVIAAIVAIFIQRPVQGYFDTARRAQLTDTADTALRRMTRDLRHALPNSVRVTSVGGRFYLEMLLTSGGGRYRAEPRADGTGDPLDFTAADASFEGLGPVPAFAAGQSIVVANLGPGSTADAYAGDNRTAWTGLGAGNILTIGAKQFPVNSPANRYQVISGPVTYECDPSTGQNVLRRYEGYAIAAAQPTPPAGTPGVLALDVSGCTFAYDPNVANTRTGVVSLFLQLTLEGETLNLFQQAHVSNAP